MKAIFLSLGPWVTAVALILDCAQAAAQSLDDWPLLARDATRSGATGVEVRPPFTRKWYRLFADEGLQSGVQPVVADGGVFIGTLRGTFYRLSAETGQVDWVFEAGGPILHAAAVQTDRVFFGCADGNVHALDARSGRSLWLLRTGAAVWNAPVALQGMVLIGGRDGRLYAIDADTGHARWSADTGAPLLQSPAVDVMSKRVYIGGEDMRVRAFALDTGRPVWTSDRLPGASFRGYHPVIALDGSVLVTSAPVIGYDRFQNLLLDMAREVFGDFASWRHRPEENERLRADNFRLLEKPETYRAQLDYLRRRLTDEPAFQTFFVLDAVTGRQRYVAPIVASESMNGPGAPPIVAVDGRVIVKYQVLLRSRYEHYSPFLNVGYLDTTTGDITPIMDQARTYGWHDSLLLIHDEQSQLSAAGQLLVNTHQDNVNGLDLRTLKGYAEPFAWNVHEPAPGEALTLRLEVLRGRQLTPGNEWLARGTAVYGGGSALDVPAVFAGGSFYYLPTHELNAGCALIAYRSTPGATPPKRISPPLSKPSDAEWKRIQDLPWDWDSLGTPRCRNLLEALPGPVPGTTAAPLTAEAENAVARIADADLERFIWNPAFDPAAPVRIPSEAAAWAAKLRTLTEELLNHAWRPLLLPAGKAPEEAYRFFTDPYETLYTLLLARPFLDDALRERVDAHLPSLVGASPRNTDAPAAESRTVYDAPLKHLKVVDEPKLDPLGQLYPLWLWSRTPAGKDFVQAHWKELRERWRTPVPKRDDDAGNARLAGLFGFCRLAKEQNDTNALEAALPATRQALRARLVNALALTRGGVIGVTANGHAAMVRWRHLSPDVAQALVAYALPIERRLMASYVDYQRPGWWLAWNVEQLMRNEVPYQLPSTPLEIFTARALLLAEPAKELASYLDIPWCRADEFYLQKLALTLRAAGR